MSYSFNYLKMYDRNLRQVLLRAEFESYTYIDPDDGEINETSSFWLILVLRTRAPYIRLLCCSFNELNINLKFDIVSGMKITRHKWLKFKNIHSAAELILKISDNEKSKKLQMLMQKIINCPLTADDVLRVVKARESTNLIQEIETDEIKSSKIHHNIINRTSLEERSLSAKIHNDSPINFKKNVVSNLEEPNFISITRKNPEEYVYSSRADLSKGARIEHKGHSLSQNIPALSQKKMGYSNSINHSQNDSREHIMISEKALSNNEKYLIKNKKKYKGEFDDNELNESSAVNSSIKEDRFKNSKRSHNKMSSIHKKLHSYICDELEKNEELCRAFYDIISYKI